MPQTPEERRISNRAHSRAYYAAHKEESLARGRAYKAAHREELLAKKRIHDAAHREELAAKFRVYRLAHKEELAAKFRAYADAHKEELAAKDRAYAATHKTEIAAKNRAYVAAHPAEFKAWNAARRARKANAAVNDLSVAQWEEIKAAYDHRCVYCGQTKQRLTQDHIVPLVKGGTHTFSNIVPACRSCNSKKHVGPPLVPVQPLLFTLAASRKA